MARRTTGNYLGSGTQHVNVQIFLQDYSGIVTFYMTRIETKAINIVGPPPVGSIKPNFKALPQRKMFLIKQITHKNVLKVKIGINFKLYIFHAMSTILCDPSSSDPLRTSTTNQDEIRQIS